MSKAPLITEDELIKALQDASEGAGDDGPGHTTEELMERLGLNSHKQVHQRLHVLHKQGRLATGQKRAVRMDGQKTLKPSYWIKPE